MGDDAGAAQARELLRELNGQLANISQKIATVERRHRRTSARGAMLDRRQLSSLRRELQEAHRLVDGLHRRFPDALTAGRVIAQTVGQISPWTDEWPLRTSGVIIATLPQLDPLAGRLGSLPNDRGE